MNRKSSKTLELQTPAPTVVPKQAGDGYHPFPVDALPAPVGEFVREGASALGCDAACLALPVLAVVAAAIGNSRAIRLKEGTQEPWLHGATGAVPGAHRVRRLFLFFSC